MEENPKITGGLKEAINKAAEDSIKGCCTEVYVESAVYHCLDLCITNPKIEGGAVTAEILSKMDPTKKSALMDDLRKLSRDIIKEKAVDASLVHPNDIVLGRNIEPHLYRMRKLKEMGLSKDIIYTIDDFIYSILLGEDSDCWKVLEKYGFGKESYMAELFTNMMGGFGITESDLPKNESNDGGGDDAGSGYSASEFEKAGQATDIHTRSVDPNSSTPALDEFGIDMTKLAKEGKYDAVIGREKEAKQIIEILCCRKKNNAMVIGKAGTGKTALIEYLAQLISSGNVPSELKGKRIISLSSTL